MRVIAFEIEDEDVLEAYFGEDSPPRSLVNLLPDHGKVIFDGDMDAVPVPGDAFVFGAEYAVVCRIHDIGEKTILLVLARMDFNVAGAIS